MSFQDHDRQVWHQGVSLWHVAMRSFARSSLQRREQLTIMTHALLGTTLENSTIGQLCIGPFSTALTPFTHERSGIIAPPQARSTGRSSGGKAGAFAWSTV